MWLVKVSLLSSRKNGTPRRHAQQEQEMVELPRIYPLCCIATKTVRCTYILEMNVVDFQTWVQRRDRERREHVPEVEKIIPLVQAAQGGRARAEIARAIDLDRDTLSAVLDAFVRSGLLVLRRQGGIEVYHASAGAGW